ncbi:hypothetical protein FVP60_10105 [Microbacterium mitrae]|uniref:Uncharacterized protein n=1 Tax=Microbacterium mitrae TaxID=664640 RepID=A0A5C8HN94_9MICO|nr:hypothetical protein [Microbacterium mitrae]TXK04109.1 hypothetical protein FVP60_10105 [Microbacterium mitrae]
MSVLSGVEAVPFDLRWLQADDDVFVATHEGEYAGFIAVAPAAGYFAHGARGERLGKYRTRALAQDAVQHARAKTRPILRAKARKMVRR